MKEMLNEKDTIQLMRGLAIISVVMFHALSVLPLGVGLQQVNSINNVVGMSIFFILSGYVFEISYSKYRSIGFGKFAKKKILRLGVPYLSYSILLYAIVVCANMIPQISAILQNTEYHRVSIVEILKAIVLFQNHIGIHLWFIVCLLIITLLNYFYEPKRMVLEFMVSIVLSCVLRNWIDSTLLFRVVFYYPFFIFGRIIRIAITRRFYIPRCIKYGGVISVIVFLSMSFCRPYVNSIAIPGYNLLIRFLRYGNYMAIGLCGTYIVFLLAIFILSHSERIANQIIGVGNDSYAIYLLHQPFIAPPVAILIYSIANSILVATLMSTLLGILIPIVLTKHILLRSNILSCCLLGRRK